MLTNTIFEIMRELLLNLLCGIWIYFFFIIKYLYSVLTNKADEQFNFSFVMMVILLQTNSLLYKITFLYLRDALEVYRSICSFC